uniref:Uncharacterized protein n=1 Tax=Oryza nivara TaxID=4536 RepID=A0A0E0ILI9_ORYNI
MSPSATAAESTNRGGENTRQWQRRQADGENDIVINNGGVYQSWRCKKLRKEVHKLSTSHHYEVEELMTILELPGHLEDEHLIDDAEERYDDNILLLDEFLDMQY